MRARQPRPTQDFVTSSFALITALILIGLAFAGSVAAQTPSGPGWTKLSESVDAAAFGFQAGTYDASRRVIWYADPTTSIGRMWRFDLATNQWSKIEDPAFVNQGTRHNCSLAYDPINDRIWISECAPSGTTGYWYFDPKTNRFVQYSTQLQPCSVDPLLIYDPTQKALYCVGGWRRTGETYRMALAPPGTWQALNAPAPPLVTAGREWALETNVRGSFDAARGQMWVIDENSELWRFDAAAKRWNKIAATGPKPPGFTVFALDPGGDQIVGFVGYNDWERNDLRRQTYLLDLKTNVWTLGPGGASAPTPSMYSAISAYTDEAGRRAILMVSPGPAEVWAWSGAGGAVSAPSSKSPMPSPAPPPAPVPPPPAAVPLPRSDVTIKSTLSLAVNSTQPIQQVEYLADGVPLGKPDTVAPYARSWKLSRVLAKRLSVRVRFADAQVRSYDIAEVVSLVGASLTPPPGLVASALAPTGLPRPGVTIKGSLSVSVKSDQPIQQVEYLADGVPLGKPDTVAPYSRSWRLPRVLAKRLSVRVTFADGQVRSYDIADTLSAPQPTSGQPAPRPSPSSPQSFTLNLSAAGSGSGSVGPGGSYEPGSLVALVATPTAGSRFDGWSGDPDCLDGSVTMSANRSCVGNFSLAVTPLPQPPPAPGGQIPLPLKTFVARELKRFDTTPFPKDGQTKHIRFAYDPNRKRTCTGGGDMNPSDDTGNSQNNMFCYDLATDTWETVVLFCRPKGEVMPAHPDEVPWVYDTKRQRFVMLAGLFATPVNPGLCRSDALTNDSQDGAQMIGSGLFALYPERATNKWEILASLPTFLSLTGNYDPVRDELVFIQNSGCGNEITHLSLATQQVGKSTPFCVDLTLDASGTGTASPHMFYDHWALDPVGRKAYLVAPTPVYAKGEFVRFEARFWRYDLDTGALDRLPAPPLPAGAKVDKDVIIPVWDSVNRVVLWPHVDNHCGVLRGLYVFRPATGAWTKEPIVQPEGRQVIGNLAFFDPDQNVMVLGGSVFCGDHDPAEASIPAQTHMFLYRYGP